MAKGERDADDLRVPRWIEEALRSPDPAGGAPDDQAPPPTEPAAPAAGAKRLLGWLHLEDAVQRYRGSREAAEPQRRWTWVFALVSAAIVVLALVLLLVPGHSGRNKPAGVGGPLPPAATSGPPTASASAPPRSAPAAPPPALTPTATAPPAGAGNGDGNVNQTFGPLTIEAESKDNTLGGSAFVDDYPGASGGKIVRNIGDWDLPPGPGTLKFNDVAVPFDGTYSLTFAHVNIDNERSRTAVITVDGQDPVLVTITGNSTCCLTTTVRVTLKKGKNSITFSNLSNHAPSIDKITVQAP
jgi:hypothetical protein